MLPIAAGRLDKSPSWGKNSENQTIGSWYARRRIGMGDDRSHD